MKLNLTAKYKSGFSLFISILVVSVILIITFSVANLSTKQISFATISRESERAIFAADAGIECALYWDSKPAVSAFDPNTISPSISCAGVVMETGDPLPDSSGTMLVGGGGGGVPSDVVFMEDSVPTGAGTGSAGGDNWANWIASNPAPFSGTLSSQSNIAAGMHQHYFEGANAPLAVSVGDTMVAYVYIDPANVPSEVMLQWKVGGSWEHRAYWGANSISWGTNNTNSRRPMGSLPASGQWVRLLVPASQVGLEGFSVNGIAFTLVGGRASWDHAGKSINSGAGNPTSKIGFSLNSASNPTTACTIVSITKNADGTTDIYSKGYNTCNASDLRRVERGIEVHY